MYKKTHEVFFVFYFVQLYFFPYECPGLCQHSVSLEHFVERKPLISEEWTPPSLQMEEQTVSSISCLERVLTILIYLPTYYTNSMHKKSPLMLSARAQYVFKLSYILATNVWIPTTLMKKSHAAAR